MPLLGRAVSTLSHAGLPGRLPLAGRGLGGLGGSGGMTGSNNSQTAALAAYGQVGTLFSVVNRIAESVALVDWNLYQQAPGGNRTLLDDATAPANHPATAIWTHPNPFFSRQEFLQTSQQHIDLAGESFWLISQGGADGPTIPRSGIQAGIELWPIRPDRIRIVTDPDKYIAGYVYQAGSEQIPLPSEAVVHLRIPNPNDPYRGFGPVQSMMTDLDAERYAAQWSRNFFMNSAEPGGIIQFDTPLTDVDFERLVMRWREQHQGVANAHRVAILERGTWVDRKYTQRDMQFLQLRELNRDIILLAFGVHSAILGVAKDVNRANAIEAEVGFSRWVLRPRLARIKSALNERVMPFFGNNLTMNYLDPTPNDTATAANVATAMYVGRWATLNEARDVGGLDAWDGPEGDQFLPQSEAPLMPPEPPRVLPPGGLRGAGTPEDAALLAPTQRLLVRGQCPHCARRIGDNINPEARLHCPRCRVVVSPVEG